MAPNAKWCTPCPQAECDALRKLINCNVCHQRQVRAGRLKDRHSFLRLWKEC